MYEAVSFGLALLAQDWDRAVLRSQIAAAPSRVAKRLFLTPIPTG